MKTKIIAVGSDKDLGKVWDKYNRHIPLENWWVEHTNSPDDESWRERVKNDIEGIQHTSWDAVVVVNFDTGEIITKYKE